MLSRLLLVAVTIVAPISILEAGDTQSEGLEKNGDFEEFVKNVDGIEVPEGWKILSGDAEIISDQSLVSSGERALHIVNRGTGSWTKSDSIKVAPNTEYKITASFFSQRTNGENKDPFWGIRVYESDGGWNPPDGSEYIISSRGEKGSWITKEGTFRTRSGTTTLYIGIYTSGNDVTVDKLSLTEVLEGAR